LGRSSTLRASLKGSVPNLEAAVVIAMFFPFIVFISIQNHSSKVIFAL
jgi:hypothetical protein